MYGWLLRGKDHARGFPRCPSIPPPRPPGVLKSLSFLFEYIGEMGKDYIYAVTPLLEDALMDRDLVHRQIASNAVKRARPRIPSFEHNAV